MAGLPTALQGVIADRPDDGAGQDDLFGELPGRPAVAGVPAIVASEGKRGPGRPKGSRNRSTEEWRQFVLSRHRSPLVQLAEIAEATPEELARAWGLYRYEYYQGERVAEHLDTGAAAARKVEAMRALLPYLHQAQPQAVEMRGEQRAIIVIGDAVSLQPGYEGRVAGGGLPIVIEGEVNQQVAGAGERGSDGGQSDGGAMSSAINGLGSK